MKGGFALVEKNKGGRPSHTLLDFMRIKAWLAFIMLKLDVKTYAEIREKIVSLLPAGQALTNYEDYTLYVQNVRWDRHAELKSGPNDTQLKLVEKLPLCVGSASIYKIGPLEGQKSVPLWMVFEQDFDLMWEFLNSQISEMKDMRIRGAPLITRMQSIINLFVPLEKWNQLDFKTPSSHPAQHLVLESYKSGYFQPSFRLLTIAMAIYRIALNAGESMAQVEYLIRGLLAEPCEEILKEYNIYTEFVAAFNQLEINDLLQRGEINLAQDLLSKMMGPKN